MQFTTVVLALAATAAASPALLERTNWGSCQKDCQYTCTTNGLLNIITCVSALNGNKITIPIADLLLKREEHEARDSEKRCSVGCSKGGDATCCTTNGLVNVLTCTDLLNDNSISIPILDVIGL